MTRHPGYRNHPTLLLWRLAAREAGTLLAASCLILFFFSWLSVWLASLIDLGAVGLLIRRLPLPMQRFSPVPIAQLTTSTGLLGTLYTHPIVLVMHGVWAAIRGTDAVAGRLERGTLELLLARPIRRTTLLATHIGISGLGSVALSVAVLLGVGAGLRTATFDDPPSLSAFVPLTLNLASLSLGMLGLATLVSSRGRYTRSVLGTVAAIFLVEFILSIVAQGWPAGRGLRYLTFFAAYEPQVMLTNTPEPWWLCFRLGAILLTIGAASIAVAAVVFHRRDLPPPL